MRIRLFGTLRTAVEGHKEVEVAVADGAAVHDVLRQLVAAYPSLRGKVYGAGSQSAEWLLVLVNGRAIQYLAGLDTRLHEGDRVALFPPVAGG